MSAEGKGSKRRRTRPASETRVGPVRVFLGGTFDGLHRGHLHLLAFARRRGLALAARHGRPGVHVTVVIARDESVVRIKHRRPHHSQSERRQLVSALRIVDRVLLGVPNEFIRSVRKVDPDLIVLGYDQRAGWEDSLHAAGIDARVVRCTPYRGHRLKSSKLRTDLVKMPT